MSPDARRPRAAHDLIALRCGVADGGGMEREQRSGRMEMRPKKQIEERMLDGARGTR